jgi:hypothetical protein
MCSDGISGAPVVLSFQSICDALCIGLAALNDFNHLHSPFIVAVGISLFLQVVRRNLACCDRRSLPTHLAA